MRRSSLIEAGTGQVVGYLYVGIVLNDNFALLENIRSGSNSENLVLAVDTTPLVSTLKAMNLIRWTMWCTAPKMLCETALLLGKPS